MATDLKLAWAAGLVDGEGCARIFRVKTTRTRCGYTMEPRIQVGMTDEVAIRELTWILGVGSVNGPYMHTKSTKPVWRWTAARRKAQTAAQLLLPFAVTKRDELQAILDHYLVAGS